MDKIAHRQDSLTQHIQDALAGLKSDVAVTWYISQETMQQELIESFSQQCTEQQDQCIVAMAAATENSAFGPVRSLLSQLFPLLEQHFPDTVKECVPELQVLLPEQIQDFEEARSLDHILAPSINASRMLPLESEYVFRIAMRTGWLIEQVAQLLASQQRRLVLIFPYLDHVDRPTLLVVYHLCCRARSGHFGLLLLSALNPCLENSRERQGSFDTVYEQQQFLRKIYEKVQPAFWIAPLDVDPSVQATFSVGENNGSAALRLAEQLLTNSSLPDAKAQFIRACSESLRLLNAEDVLHLAASVLPQAIAAQDQTFCAEIWLWIGIAYASIGTYEQTVACFQQGLEYAEQAHEPALSVKLLMYLALVLAKRLKQLTEAEHILAQGYALIEQGTDAAMMLERGWLHNVQALIRYNKKDYTQALRLTQTAFEFLRPHHDQDATALKTNLIANASIVYERGGKYERAIAMWKLFSTFVGEGDSTFSKYYYYRLAALQRGAGQNSESSTNFQQAFRFAERVQDWVTMEAAARTLSRMAYESADYPTALKWVEITIGLRAKIGDTQHMDALWMFAAACAYNNQESEKAITLLQEAARCTTMQNAQTATEEILILMRSGVTPIARAQWEPWLPVWPPTVLHLPIHIFLP